MSMCAPNLQPVNKLHISTLTQTNFSVHEIAIKNNLLQSYTNNECKIVTLFNK